ncbi:MAG: hypothetical protein M3Q10_17650 [Chloroflexota bacterium]|nr:hypothetical protein [Chloroflexota bacterium]
MALYLVVHTPRPAAGDELRAPSRLSDLARASSEGEASPRWLRAWSPDLHDDRIFSLWEARNGEEIRGALERFGFLDDMTAEPLRVREWGPAEVLAAEA